MANNNIIIDKEISIKKYFLPKLHVDICALPKDVGPCEASFRRFYYNTKTGDCEKFIYGGCRGNSNNFKSKYDCFDTCKGIWEKKFYNI